MTASGADPKVMAKVRKLLNLGADGSGGTEAERDLAMQRAQELMMKYNLDLAAIDTHGENAEKKGDVDKDQGGLETNRRSDWEGRLLSTIAYYNLCRTYYMPGAAPKSKVWFVVGRPHNIEFVKTLHQFCIDQLKAECRLALQRARHENPQAARNPNSFRRSFYDGAQMAIGSRLADQQRARVQDTGSKGQELIRSETADIDAYLSEMFGGRLGRAPKRRGSRNLAGRNAGADAGRRADLFPGRKLGS